MFLKELVKGNKQTGKLIELKRISASYVRYGNRFHCLISYPQNLMSDTSLLFSAGWYCRSRGSLCHRYINQSWIEAQIRPCPLVDCPDTQKHTRFSPLSFISPQAGKLGVGCCGSHQAQGPVGLKIALPAAGMTQTAFFSHTAGPSRVGLSVAEHRDLPGCFILSDRVLHQV